MEKKMKILLDVIFLQRHKNIFRRVSKKPDFFMSIYRTPVCGCGSAAIAAAAAARGQVAGDFQKSQ